MKSIEEDEDVSSGCLLCTHGRYVGWPHNQKLIRCNIHGELEERESCPDCNHEPIREIDLDDFLAGEV